MSWVFLVLVVLVLTLVVGAMARRRGELRAMEASVSEIARARERGSAQARLQFPHVDLSQCMGCGSCIRACPEEGVLELVHGQALVAHGARCVGHGRCAEACPVDAISITLGDLSRRSDIPAIGSNLESQHVPGLYLAGELTGYALVRTAVTHGSSVADEIAKRCKQPGPEGVLDLVVVGAGPAGLSCSLGALQHGLDFVTLDQDSLGGTVSHYPRGKLVMTHPVKMPMGRTLDRSTYSKEELIDFWREIVDGLELPVRTGVEVTGVEKRGEVFTVKTNRGEYLARNVCLALGRRGSPRKLGVPGEELPKVAYSLIDARSHTYQRILVVGGGDSAIEAALGLSEMPGNTVTLSYRKAAFFRIKARNEKRLDEALREGRIEVRYESDVAAIEEDWVTLTEKGEEVRLPNDEVFVFAGGLPPFELLQRAGVSFDPADLPAAPPPAERGTGLFRALSFALLLAVAVGSFALVFRDYYGLSQVERLDSRWHDLLSPSGRLGLTFGVAALAAMITNVAYLARRSLRIPIEFGSLRNWMTLHVATGLAALLLVILHSAMAPGDTVGGYSFWGLVVLVVSGAVGRYLYSFVPRASNGRELELDELRGKLAESAAGWDRTHRELGDRVQGRIEELVRTTHWGRSLPRRLLALVRGPRELAAVLDELRADARTAEVPKEQVDELCLLARSTFRTAVAAAHFEDLRGVLSSWRWLHRWVALLVGILVVAHVVTALRFSRALEGILG